MGILDLIKGNISQEELLNYFNAIIIYTKIRYSNIRGFVNLYRGRYYIYINDNLSYYKKKKTILHELAHIELSQLEQIDNDLFAFKVDKYEDEADLYLKMIEETIQLENTSFDDLIKSTN